MPEPTRRRRRIWSHRTHAKRLLPAELARGPPHLRPSSKSAHWCSQHAIPNGGPMMTKHRPNTYSQSTRIKE